MVEYKIVEKCSAQTLSQAINLEIKNGWISQGGGAVAMIVGTVHYYQAMIKINKENQ